MVIVTATVAVTAEQPPLDGVVYVTVYVPAVLVLGVIAPVLASIVKPVPEVYVPPVYALAPLKVTLCAFTSVVQNGPLYAIVAVGGAVIVTATVAVAAEQPPLDGVVYVTEYIPEVLVLGVIEPVLESIVKPAAEL